MKLKPYDIITKSFDKKIPTKHAEGGRISNQSGGPVDHDALVQMYLAEGLSYEEAFKRLNPLRTYLGTH